MFWFVVGVLTGGMQAASLAWPWADWRVPGIAPGEVSGWLQIVSLALLVLSLRHAHQVGQAVWRGWVFATVWLAGSFWWLYVSMHTYGGLAAWMAVLAVFALAGALALLYALAAGALCAWAPRARWLQALMFASLWTLAELARGRWFTGFPWGAGGYAQVDLMAAWAPWVGVYGMGAIAAVLAYALALTVSSLLSGVAQWALPPTRRPGAPAAAPWVARRGGLVSLLGGLMAVVALGALLASVIAGDRWHDLGRRGTAASGEMKVWLLQGNIPQNEKFESGTGIATALGWYPAQVAAAAQAQQRGTGPDLVVAPETAIPLLPQQLNAEFWEPLFASLQSSSTGASPGLGLLVGIPLGSYEAGYTNSAWAMTPAMLKDRAGAFPGERFYRYSKQHLVPFGEFIPPLFRWFTNLMHIPLGDFARGALPQPAWTWASQRIAPNICYEDLFGEELAQSFTDAAGAPTVLINLSNIGWFGDTVAIDQHLQISRLRALELGRPMLRATNTGATAVIDHTGRVTHQLPRLTRDRLEATVQGRTGLTPYAVWASRWGLWPVWGACAAVLLLAALARSMGRRAPSRRAA
ncbi:apolipoprotein N-acyltransferase [Hydrogenophaga sp. A37]|uniref:apolipoprotein N-acyltransferase n=1 Tax=Hydrogenophaga sp. A37 TaxID=1945864 RepID=UPI00209B9E36|nr:apolipoprotein N-acyltransferase [Hydrogenophaga sp. A37]